MVESGGTTMVVFFAGGDGLLLLKEMQPARVSGNSRTIGPGTFMVSSASMFAADSRSISAANLKSSG
jgi:hypothetical protein